MTRLVEVWPERFGILYSDVTTASSELPHQQEPGRRDARKETLALLHASQAADAAGRADEADRYLAKAQRAAADAGDRNLEATVWAEHGLQNQDRDHYDAAVRLYQQAEATYREIGDQQSVARMHLRIGEVYDQLGDLEEAESYYKQGREQGEKVGDANLQLRALAMLAAVAIDQKRKEVIKERLTDSLKALQTRLHDFAEEPREHISTLTRDTIIATQILGQACAWEDCPQLAAVPLVKFSLAVHRTLPDGREAHEEISDDLYYLGMAYTQAGQLNEAWRALEQARDADLQLGRHEDYWLLNQMGVVREKEGRLNEALRYYTRATERLEDATRNQRISRGKFSSREATFSFYQDVVQVLTKMHTQTSDERQLREAFRYLERGKAQTLLDFLAGGSSVKGQDGATPAHTSMNVHSPTRATVNEVEVALADGTLLLEYALGEEQSILWAIARTGTRVYPSLPNEDTISELVKQYVGLHSKGPLTRGEVAEDKRIGRDLYRALLQPAAPALQRANRIIIVPDGVLYSLPFEALPIEEEAAGKGYGQDTERSERIDYLGVRYATSYVPSSSVLLALKRRGSQAHRASGAARSQIAIFGGAIFAHGHTASNVVRSACGKRAAALAALPGSTEEAQRIAAIYGLSENSAAFNVGKMASAKHLRGTDLTRYRILHFATHAVAPDRISDLSQPALLLSSDGSDDGCLNMSDIFKLRLDADLVVLSACETAIGRMYRGEGMVGLTSAFLYAGSRSVIASLWLVNDQSTSLFMTSFYRHLKQGDPVAEALRQARIEIMGMRVRSDVSTEEQWLAAPYFWAPFVLIGDGS